MMDDMIFKVETTTEINEEERGINIGDNRYNTLTIIY